MKAAFLIVSIDMATVSGHKCFSNRYTLFRKRVTSLEGNMGSGHIVGCMTRAENE